MSLYAKRYVKQPDDELSLPVPFDRFLAGLDPAVTLVSIECDCDDGITIENTPNALVGTGVPLLISGGDNGRFYTAYAKLTMSDGQMKRVDILVRVQGEAIVETVYDDGNAASFDDDYDDYDEGGA